MTMPPISNPLSLDRSARAVSGSLKSEDAEIRPTLVMRKFHIASLTADGRVYETDQIGPARPLFESAFSAFAHGTLIKTADGQVAIEDLEPGAQIITSERGAMPLLWIGSMTFVPNAEGGTRDAARLTRIMADSFGPTRPAQDLMAGPGARLLTRCNGVHDIVGADHILCPASDMVDGVHVIDIVPPRPVTVYHLCLHRHATIQAAGLDVESYHPGPGFERNLGPNMLQLFLSFFPHIHAPSDFGPLTHPRVSVAGQSTVETG